MAVASTRTLLPLDRWATIMRINPTHFNGVVIGDPTGHSDDLNPASFCSMPMVQFSWQAADHIGREEVAQAIRSAEDRIMAETGFALARDFAVSETKNITRPFVPELYSGWGLSPRWQFQTVEASWGFVIQGGKETKTSLGTDIAVTYANSNGDVDGYKETATITINVPTGASDPEGGATPDEIAIYYPASSLPPGEFAADDKWEIRPISVSITAGVATIVCRRDQLVKWSLLEGWPSETAPIDGLVDANFLATVDVYRHWADPSQQVTFEWEGVPNFCGCASQTCPTCTVSLQSGCMIVRDNRLGMVAPMPGSWNPNTIPPSFDPVVWSVLRQPDRVRLNYKHGWKDNRLRTPEATMDDRWAKAITYYSCTFLERDLCACTGLDSFVQYWCEDRAEVGSQEGRSHSFQNRPSVLDNPLGTTRGAIYAYNLIAAPGNRLGKSAPHHQ